MPRRRYSKKLIVGCCFAVAFVSFTVMWLFARPSDPLTLREVAIALPAGLLTSSIFSALVFLKLFILRKSQRNQKEGDKNA